LLFPFILPLQVNHVQQRVMPDQATPRRPLFPAIEPYKRGRLQVSELHEVYYECCGHPAGKPVVVLHGGPGGGSSPTLRRFHDPARYNIILFDQRGCGNSTPHACLTDNTTWHLVADMELLRVHLNIESWQVFGGSWGSTLALAYAQTHPQRVQELVLRGIFAIRDWEVRWLYQEGAGRLFPEAFEAFASLVPESEQHDLITAYHKRLHDPDETTRTKYARAWSQWEGSCLTLLPNPERVTQFGEDRFATAFAAIECHYFVNRGFMAHDGALLDGVSAISHLPGTIVHGRYDVVTPVATAFDLSKLWPKAELVIVADAGHSAVEPGITDALVRATDRYAAT
jgi:proline iminopeptidase